MSLLLEPRPWYYTGRFASLRATIALKQQQEGLLVDIAIIDPVACLLHSVQVGETYQVVEDWDSEGILGGGKIGICRLVNEENRRVVVVGVVSTLSL